MTPSGEHASTASDLGPAIGTLERGNQSKMPVGRFDVYRAGVIRVILPHTEQCEFHQQTSFTFFIFFLLCRYLQPSIGYKFVQRRACDDCGWHPFPLGPLCQPARCLAPPHLLLAHASVGTLSHLPGKTGTRVSLTPGMPAVRVQWTRGLLDDFILL